VWLYVLLAIVIPTSLGFVMGLVKTGLNLVPFPPSISSLCLLPPALFLCPSLPPSLPLGNILD